jgi:hypothetical protein
MISRRKGKLLALCAVLTGILVSYGLAELTIRLIHKLRDGIPVFALQNPPSAHSLDNRLGWRATENFLDSREEMTMGGKKYVATASQDKLGFRLFGDLRVRNRRLLVIGDSFTHSTWVSDNKLYYAA